MMHHRMKSKSSKRQPNKRPPDVRPRQTKGRPQRTRHALRVALTELLRERPFGEITVQQLLQRAGVGRATFYAHFQDKDDLLLTSYCGMLEVMSEHLQHDPPGQRRLLPVREFFEHVDAAMPILETLTEDGKQLTLWDLAAQHFARTLEPSVRSSATARFLAGAMLEQLKWWLWAKPRPSAETMDVEFHRLAHAALLRL